MMAQDRIFKPTMVVVHHSGTTDGPDISWTGIRRYHVNNLGWSDIGYHAGAEIYSADDPEFVCLIGRPWDRQGAHCRGYNESSLGICFVGNFEIDTPEIKHLVAGAKIIRLWLSLFNIPRENIFPHNQFNVTDCPGKNFDMDLLRSFCGG